MLNQEMIDDMFQDVLEEVEYAKILSYVEELYCSNEKKENVKN